MSASRWPLLAGDQGWNFPDNYVKAVDQPVLHRLGGLHAEVHGAGHRAADRARARAGPARAGVDPLEGPAAHVVPRAERARAGLGVAAVLRAVLAARRARWRRSWTRLGCHVPRHAERGAVRRRCSSSSGATPASTCCSCWSGLQAIPADVYEAARIDGASRWQTFRHITLPLLRPTLALTTVLCVTGSLLAFEQFYILTKGGPDNSTISVVQLIYTVAFQGQNDLGVAAALSVLVLVALVLVNVLQTARVPPSGGELTTQISPPATQAAPPRAVGRAAATTLAGIALRTPYWVFTGGARRDLPVPAGLDGGRLGLAAPGHQPGRRLGLRQLRDARRATRPASGSTSPTRRSSRCSPWRSRCGLAARRVRVRAVPLPRQEPAVPGHARDPHGARTRRC